MSKRVKDGNWLNLNDGIGWLVGNPTFTNNINLANRSQQSRQLEIFSKVLQNLIRFHQESVTGAWCCIGYNYEDDDDDDER